MVEFRQRDPETFKVKVEKRVYDNGSEEDEIIRVKDDGSGFNGLKELNQASQDLGAISGNSSFTPAINYDLNEIDSNGQYAWANRYNSFF